MIRRRKNVERDMCRAFVKALHDLENYNQIINPESFNWYHIPNGQNADEGAFLRCILDRLPFLEKYKDALLEALAYARKIAGGIDKSIGAKPGVPDYCFMWRDSEGTPWVGYLEAKSPTGRLSDEQKAFKKYCDQEKIPFAEFRSVWDGIKTLRDWGIIKETAVI